MPSSDEDEGKKEQKTDDFTIAGYKPGELLKAPVEPPDPEEVGERASEDDKEKDSK